MSILDRIIKGKKATRVGIDISSTTVKLLELSESNGGFRVESYSVSSLPHGAVYEKNINNIGEVATAIQSVIHQSRTRATEVIAAVSGSSVINKVIAMPAGLTDDEMETQIALEAAGEGEVVSQPKVITGDKQQATIKSGTEIPYQEGAASGAATTQFKEAVLQLTVTPNITPDDRILLDLVVNQDSVGELVPSANGGLVPSIDTTELTTQVLVGNGETVVLGGVFRNEETQQIQKVPVLGDLPGVGTLFRSTANTNKKVETLIFITPRILSEVLLD